MKISKIAYLGLGSAALLVALNACGGKSDTPIPILDSPSVAEATVESIPATEDVKSIDGIVSTLSPDDQKIVRKLESSIKSYYNDLSRGFKGENVGDVTQRFVELFDDLNRTYPHIGLAGGRDNTDFTILATYLESKGILFANFTAPLLGGAPDFLLADIINVGQKSNRYDPSIKTKMITYGNPIVDTFLNEQGGRLSIKGFSIGTTSYFPASSDFEEADEIWGFYERFGSNSDPNSLFSLDKIINENNPEAISNGLGMAFRYVGFSDTYQNVKSNENGKAKFKQLLSERHQKYTRLHEESIVDDNVNLNPETLTDTTFDNQEVRAYLRDLANLPLDMPGEGYSMLASMSVFLISENPSFRRVGEEVFTCLLSEIASNPGNYPNIDFSQVDLGSQKGALQLTVKLPYLSEKQLSDTAARCFNTLYPAGPAK
ncbi:MAG: hypothetical protein IH964_13500 [Candidatus Dadabacteria bacterium]|nr:hypothetical protein [Candidatus Dadabacteria bacterium]